MTIEQLKSLAEAKPFRSFVLETTGGNYIRIDQENDVLFCDALGPPDRRSVVIIAADKQVHFVTRDELNAFAVTFIKSGKWHPFVNGE